MPSVLEGFVEELGSGLDEKAKLSLREVDPTSALAFLHRLNDRGDGVRNPSAFVATAVKTAIQRGGSAGPAELESAVQRLKQDEHLDESALGALQKGTPQEAINALSGYLTQEASAVRNASAYVTRNISNAKKRTPMGQMGGGIIKGGVMCQGGMGSYGGYGGCSSQGASLDSLMAKWSRSFDPKAMEALTSIGPQAAYSIMQEMDSKGPSVRNPSAYVCRAVANGKLNVPAGMASGGCQVAPNFSTTVGSLAMQKFQGLLDSDAVNALSKVTHEQASAILTNLESRAVNVRNPSAYVVRSVANLADAGPGAMPPILAGGGCGGFSDGSNECFGGGFGGGEGCGGGWGSKGKGTGCMGGFAGGIPATLAAQLDEAANAALSTASPEVQHTIVEEVRSKMGSIKNVSAYVQRAVANARNGEAVSPTLASFGDSSNANSGCTGNLPGILATEVLDEGARLALNEISAEAANAILAVLESQRNKVQNPSAYVLKAVANAQRGKGAGAAVLAYEGAVPTIPRRERSTGEASPGEELTLALGEWRHQLDDKAIIALQSMSHEAASLIIQELESKSDSVRNPSAYVARAVSNARNGLLPAGGVQGSAVRDQSAQMELQEELAKLKEPLDSRAQEALEEAGPLSALRLLQQLNRSSQVKNPSAYIQRAINNEKRGFSSACPPMGMGMGSPTSMTTSGGMPAFKRQRL